MTRAQRIAFYLADVVETLCGLACVLTGHACGCWILSSEWSPLMRLDRWALNLRWNDPGPSHSPCPTCHFDRNEYIPRQQWDEDVDRYYNMGEESGRKAAAEELQRSMSNTTTTTSGGAAGCNNTYLIIWPKGGTPCS